MIDQTERRITPFITYRVVNLQQAARFAGNMGLLQEVIKRHVQSEICRVLTENEDWNTRFQKVNEIRNQFDCHMAEQMGTEILDISFDGVPFVIQNGAQNGATQQKLQTARPRKRRIDRIYST